jgi:hypothetical protein
MVWIRTDRSNDRCGGEVDVIGAGTKIFEIGKRAERTPERRHGAVSIKAATFQRESCQQEIFQSFRSM